MSFDLLEDFFVVFVHQVVPSAQRVARLQHAHALRAQLHGELRVVHALEGVLHLAHRAAPVRRRQVAVVALLVPCHVAVAAQRPTVRFRLTSCAVPG